MSYQPLPKSWVFWSFEQTPHLADVIRKVAAHCDRCQWVTEVQLTEDRRKLGFHASELGIVEPVAAHSVEAVRRLAQTSPRETMHVFYGIRGFKMNRHAFQAAAAAGAPIAIVTENRNQPGWRAALRSAAYRLDAGPIRRHVSCVFVNGYGGPRGGHRFYRELGWPAERLFPFGYFADARDRDALPPADGSFRFAYVGQLIPRKGVDVLMRALSQLSEAKWELQIFGDGPDRGALESLGGELRISDRIRFEGTVPLNQIPERIAPADALLVPSRFDGWGMVVNEGLSSGLPIVCSDTCGAQDLLPDASLGDIFRSEDADDLARVLTQRMGKPRETQAVRERRRRRYNECASSEVAAKYMIETVRSVLEEKAAPTPPWMISPSPAKKEETFARY